MDLSSFYRKNVKVDGSVSCGAGDDVEEFGSSSGDLCRYNNRESVTSEISKDGAEMMTDDSTDVSKYGSFLGSSDLGKEEQSSDQFDLESVGDAEAADVDSDNQTASGHPVVKVKTLVEYHLEFLTKHPGEVFFYGCRLCAHRFTSRNSFLVHMKLHDVRKRYPCDYCDKAYDRKFQLVHHLRLHTNETPFECEVCFIAYAREEELQQHSKIHTSDKPFECRFCLKGFPQKKALIVHLRMHTGERPFPCQFCDRTFTQKAHLQGHMVRIHIPKKKVDIQLSSDMQGDAGKAMLSLFSQARAFSSPERLASAEAVDMTVASRDIVALTTFQREKLIGCDFCDKKFTYERNKTNHMKKHGGEMQYDCDSCHKSFPSRSSLASHLLTHTSASSPFRCDICGREFNMKRNLIMHVKSHNNERPFECPACEKSFKLKYFLELHVTRIHPHLKLDELPPKKETKSFEKIENVINFGMPVTPNKRKQSKPKKVVMKSEDFKSDSECESYGEYSSESEKEMREEEPFDPAKFVDIFVQRPKKLYTKKDDKIVARSMQINLPHDLQHVKKLLNAKSTTMVPEAKSFSCPLCSLLLPNRTLLTIHLKEHEKSKPHQCTMCDKVYIQQASFEKHMKKHLLDGLAARPDERSDLQPRPSEKKLLECTICKKKYAQPASFEKHMRQHSELGEIEAGRAAQSSDEAEQDEPMHEVPYINPSDFLEVSFEHS